MDVVGNLNIARHGSSYHFHLSDFDLGILKYRGNSRGIRLGIFLCILLYQKVILSVLEDSLTQDAITDLPWFQDVCSICVDIATTIGHLNTASRRDHAMMIVNS
jgi:hypothetical protein